MTLQTQDLAQLSEVVNDLSQPLKAVLDPLGKILGGLASNPVTGLPILIATSELLYLNRILPRNIAFLLGSPTAIVDTLKIAGGELDAGIKSLGESIKDVATGRTSLDIAQDIITRGETDPTLRALKLELSSINAPINIIGKPPEVLKDIAKRSAEIRLSIDRRKLQLKLEATRQEAIQLQEFQQSFPDNPLIPGRE